MPPKRKRVNDHSKIVVKIPKLVPKQDINTGNDVFSNQSREKLREFFSNPENRGCLLFHGTGTGKTTTAIDLATAIYMQYGLKPLVLAPEVLVTQWRDEFKSSMYGQNAKSIFQPLSETIISWDTYYEKFLKSKKEQQCQKHFVIIEEAHQLVHYKHGMKILKSCLIHSGKIILLTGTPMETKIESLSFILQAIANINAKEQVEKIAKSIERLIQISDNTLNQIATEIMEGRREDIGKIVHKWVTILEPKLESSRKKFKNILQMLLGCRFSMMTMGEVKQEKWPKAQFVTELLPLTQQQETALEKIRENKNLTKETALNKARKIHLGLKKKSNLISPKLDETVRILQDSPKRTIVFANDVWILQEIAKQIPMDIVHKGVSFEEIDGMIAKYKKKETNVIAITEVAGTGLRFDETERMILLQPARNFSLEIQIVARANREGNFKNAEGKAISKDLEIYRLFHAPPTSKKLYDLSTDLIDESTNIIQEVRLRLFWEMAKPFALETPFCNIK